MADQVNSTFNKKRDRNMFLQLIVISSTAFVLSSSIASAAFDNKECKKRENLAEYRGCMADKAMRSTQLLAGKACNGKSCIAKATKVRDGLWQGGGFTIIQRRYPKEDFLIKGPRISIACEPNGHMSVDFSCRTARGPLNMRFAAPNWIVQYPK